MDQVIKNIKEKIISTARYCHGHDNPTAHTFDVVVATYNDDYIGILVAYTKLHSFEERKELDFALGATELAALQRLLDNLDDVMIDFFYERNEKIEQLYAQAGKAG